MSLRMTRLQRRRLRTDLRPNVALTEEELERLQITVPLLCDPAIKDDNTDEAMDVFLASYDPAALAISDDADLYTIRALTGERRRLVEELAGSPSHFGLMMDRTVAAQAMQAVPDPDKVKTREQRKEVQALIHYGRERARFQLDEVEKAALQEVDDWKRDRIVLILRLGLVSIQEAGEAEAIGPQVMDPELKMLAFPADQAQRFFDEVPEAADELANMIWGLGGLNAQGKVRSGGQSTGPTSDADPTATSAQPDAGPTSATVEGPSPAPAPARA